MDNWLRRILITAGTTLFLCPTAWAQSDFQGATHLVPFHEEPIKYEEQKSHGPISRLQERIDRGELKLKWDTRFGYLPSLLKELGINPDSQMLLFSKTSLQRNFISPQTPRAVYYNDDAYIGWIPGAPVMEVSEVDPILGGVFYDLPQVEEAKPRFNRNTQCMSCHASAKTMGVPGHVVRSVGTDLGGEPDLQTAFSEVNHRVSLADRWAGWFVTGQHGDQLHRGNLVGREALELQQVTPNYMGNRTNLIGITDVSGYYRQSSDIVALMVHDHQTHMHNFITRLNYETRIMLSRYGHIRYLKNQSEAFLRYLLFTEETDLEDEIQGNTRYAEAFQKLGPFDSKGRSLRQLDLRHRMFKYPCSFLIYSASFDAIPKEMLDHIYQRLFDILTGKDESEAFEMVSERNKHAIFEILLETKKGLPDYWRQSPKT